MKEFIKSNHFFKIVSVVVAALLWLYVVQFENPEFYISMSDIPVRIENESYLTQNNLILTAQNSDTVSLRIKGKRQTVSFLEKSSIYAYIDMKAVTKEGEYKLPVKVVFSENNVSVANDSMPRIKVTIEKRAVSEQTVALKTVGKVKDGYFAVPDESSKVPVNIISPESTAQLVSTARAELDITDADSYLEKNVAVKLYDANNNLITNKNIRCEPDKIKFRCNVYPVKEIPVKWNSEGEMPEGAKSIKVSANAVNIAGPADLLRETKALNLGAINLAVFTPEDNTETFKIESLFETEGLYVADDVKEITVTMNFDNSKAPETNETETENKTSVTVETIELINIPEGFTAKLMNPSASFTVSGDPNIVEFVKPTDFTVSVDLSFIPFFDENTTDYELPVTVTTPKSVTVSDVKNIKVRITKNRLQ